MPRKEFRDCIDIKFPTVRLQSNRATSLPPTFLIVCDVPKTMKVNATDSLSVAGIDISANDGAATPRPVTLNSIQTVVVSESNHQMRMATLVETHFTVGTRIHIVVKAKVEVAGRMYVIDNVNTNGYADINIQGTIIGPNPTKEKRRVGPGDMPVEYPGTPYTIQDDELDYFVCFGSMPAGDSDPTSLTITIPSSTFPGTPYRIGDTFWWGDFVNLRSLSGRPLSAQTITVSNGTSNGQLSNVDVAQPA